MATTGQMNGTDLLAYVGGVAVGQSKDFSISIDSDMIDATTKDSNKWKEFLAGDKGWTADVEALVDFAQSEGFSECFSDVTNGTKITVKFGTEVTGDARWTGDAYVSNLSLNAPMNDVVSYSFSLQGTGSLTEETVS